MSQQPLELDSLRKASRQAAIISALGAIVLFSTLGISAFKLQHVQDKQKKLEQEMVALQAKTDLKLAEIESLDKQISVLRKQKNSLLTDYRTDVGVTKQVAIEFAVKPHASMRKTGEFYGNGNPKRKYWLWLQIPDGREGEIVEVDYFFNHPTFTTQHMEGDPETPGFRTSYIGWGCMKNLVITLKLKNGQQKQLDFDMCKSILG